MRRFLPSSLALAAAMTSLPALAQDAGQWAGPYGGITFSTGSADQEYDDGGIYDLEGDGFGVILGYNMASGGWVYGGELAYSRVEIGQTDGSPFMFESILDLKGRAGRPVGRALFYGTLGMTFTQWQEGNESGLDGNGLLIGLGVDFLVSPNMVVGAEYVYRDVTSDWNATDTFEADIRTFTLRAAYKF